MLVLAAVAEELGDLPGMTVGIGPVAAAARTAAILAERRPDGVVLIGTCGSYRGGPAIHAAIVADRVGLAFGVAAMGLGYVPRAPAPIACAPALTDRLDAPRASVLTCGAVTTDPVLAERLADGWQCEHLEAFGVAHACQAAGVPFAAVLGVANAVGPDAHVEWLANREAAQAAARDLVRTLLSTDP
jgi:nucleoside phosphorylase